MTTEEKEGSRLEIWGGVECTVNRVQGDFLDQCEKNGHASRLSDLELFSGLGIKRLRYPFLWEKVAPSYANDFDWTWSDERTAELRRLGLLPIAGLLHHGGGPKYTSLLDPEFANKFALYARAFAERYPDIEDYTPINEPLTTARFSCLYGVWFPHATDDKSFVRALYNQMRAIVLAMRAIREVNPRARLIQTEDMGRCESTDKLRYQRDFENERRFLSYDFLCGAVDKNHVLFHYLLASGLSELEIQWAVENPCPPDVIGINHYLLSNRFLDHRLELYPEQFHGGNGFERYADVGAVDTGQSKLPELSFVLDEIWSRYRRPIAITEAHTHGEREAQLRWLNETWQTSLNAKARGVDLRAVTAWSLLGSFDWNTLCTQSNGFYESGVYDVRSPQPRPTALASMVSGLASQGEFEHPVLKGPGWWKTSRRILFAPGEDQKSAEPVVSGAPILIIGATGTLGRAFARLCDFRSLSFKLLNREDLDIANMQSVEKAMEKYKPWAVINAAGFVNVDLAETEREQCYRENVLGPENLARACSASGARLITFSSDLVFDGRHDKPYRESHPVSPINVYGESKAESEKRVLALNSDALVIRTSSFFGPWDEHNFVTQALRRVVSGNTIHAASDVEISPTYVPDLVNACLDLMIDGESGILHLTNKGKITWGQLARRAIDFAGRKHLQIPIGRDLVIERSSCEMGFQASRPLNSVLESERYIVLPELDNALERYFAQLEIKITEGVRL
jgi:dTDP-4-dehydrorhamnose reductase